MLVKLLTGDEKPSQVSSVKIFSKIIQFKSAV